MHAGWNLLAHHQRKETVFFKRMLIIIALVGLLPAALSEILTHSLPLKAWLCVAGSGFFCGMYFFYLARAYGSSDFTTVYPVARALPVFLVGVGDVFRGRYPTAIGWVGIILVILGCFLAPLYSLSDFRLGLYFKRASLWMLFAAIGTAGYTVIDKIASEIVLQGPATAARYGYIFFLISFMTYTICLRKGKAENQHSNSIGWTFPFFAACLNFGAYWLVLWAYQLSHHASYILAFRQFSIFVGIILAFIIYKEAGKVVRSAAGFLIVSGLIFIGFWGR
jgi:drug/metabolite transporter (DMT)-like permease